MDIFGPHRKVLKSGPVKTSMCIWSMPNGPWYLEGWYLSNILQVLNPDPCRLLKREGLLLAIQPQELLDQ